MSKKSDIIFMARIAEKAERYNEMKEYMHQVASTPDPETGKVVFITIDEIDPVTGELKVTLPFLGAITLLDKSAVDENEIETQTTDAGAADTETAAE